MAIAIIDFGKGITEKDVGITFRGKDAASGSNQTEIAFIEAVYCADIYAEQIEAEKNGTWTTTYFTDSFADFGTTKFICPKADFIQIDQIEYTL